LEKCGKQEKVNEGKNIANKLRLEQNKLNKTPKQNDKFDKKNNEKNILNE